MKTQNTFMLKWTRRVAGFIAVLMLTMSFSGHASARIIFQDDISADVVSEGININSDDGGDEDVTLKLGNDGTDATMTFDDGTGDVTLASPGGDFSFSDDNVIGTGGLDFDGAINFAGASSFRLREAAVAPGTCTEGEMYYNTTSNITYMCTATNTWTAYSTGTQDFESVYGTDADDTLTTSNNPFTINTGNSDFIVDSNDWGVNANGDLTATSFTNGTVTITGGNLNGVTGIDANTENTFEGSIFDSDAESVTGVWTWADNVAAVFGTDTDVSVQYDEAGDDRLEITGPNASVYIEDNLTVDVNATVNGTLDANGTVTLGDNGETVAIDSSDWDITTAGNMTGIGSITMDGLLTGTLGATVSGAAVSLNNNSNNAVNIGTGTSTGAVTIGGGSNTITVNTTNWDISSAGVASGFTGFTSTGTVNFSGVSRLALHQGGSNPGTCTEGDVFYNTGDNTTYICTATNTWTALSSGAQDFESVYGADADDTLTASATFDIDAVGAVGIDSDAGVTVGGSTIALNSDGGAVSLNNNVNQAVNVATGTSTGAVTIGGGSNTIAVNSSSWDISTAGAASGFTTIGASGNITTSGGDFVIGTTGLTETTANNDSGAYLVGVFDEFDNSTSTNVQDILDDLDALIGTNSPNNENLTFYAEYPDTVVYEDGANNKGMLETLYDNTNKINFYRWTSKNVATNDIDLRFKFVLPPDFSSVGNLTYQYRTNTATEANNDVEIYIYNVTDSMTLCDSDTTNGTANAWTTNNLANIATGCTGGTALSAGDEVEVVFKLLANNTANAAADVGYVKLAYNN